MFKIKLNLFSLLTQKKLCECAHPALLLCSTTLSVSFDPAPNSQTNSCNSGNEDATPDSAAYSSGAAGGAGNSSSLAAAGLLGSPDRRATGRYHLHPHHQFYPSGEALNPTYASNINLCISDDIIISVTDHDESDLQQQQQQQQQRFNPPIASSSSATNTTTNTNFIASPKSSSSSTMSSPRSPRFSQRNPVTGNGVENYGDKPRKPSSRGGPGGGNLVFLAFNLLTVLVS